MHDFICMARKETQQMEYTFYDAWTKIVSSPVVRSFVDNILNAYSYARYALAFACVCIINVGRGVDSWSRLEKTN